MGRKPLPRFYLIMKQPDTDAQQALMDINDNTPSIVQIPNTRKKVKIRALHPYTVERLARVWLAREEALQKTPEGSAETLQSYCGDVYFNIRQAVLYVLNSYWKINLFYRPMVWWWGKIRGFGEEEVQPILAEGKKKLVSGLLVYWENIVLTMDMRDSLMRMTKKEADRYQAELLSGLKQHSSKTSPNMGKQDDSSSAQ